MMQMSLLLRLLLVCTLLGKEVGLVTQLSHCTMADDLPPHPPPPLPQKIYIDPHEDIFHWSKGI